MEWGVFSCVHLNSFIYLLPSLLRSLYVTQDDIAAYKTQNKFLNSEIYQLTKLWRKSSEQEKSLMVKVRVREGEGLLRSIQWVPTCGSGPRSCSPEMQFGSQQIVDFNPLIFGHFRKKRRSSS